MRVGAKVLLVITCVGLIVVAYLLVALGVVLASSVTLDRVPATVVGHLLGAAACLAPLGWMLPMTKHYFHATKHHQAVGKTFKVCTLLFVNLLAGVLMLCDHKPISTKLG